MNAHDLIQEIIERKGKIENVFARPWNWTAKM